MKKRALAILISVMLLVAMMPAAPVSAAIGDTQGGTWGGIDWTFVVTEENGNGTLTIAPTTGTPVPDARGFTYEVGEWREAVIYKANGTASAIGGWPYEALRSKITKLVIEEGVTKIGSFAAQNLQALKGEVVIPSTVTYIGQEAFQRAYCDKITFAAGGTEALCIAQGSFKNMEIEEFALPEDRPVHMHAWVLNNCPNLKSVTFPANLTGITGTNHVDYNHNPNAQTGGGTGSSELLKGTGSLASISFGSEEVRNMFFSKDNASTNNRSSADVGLTTYINLQDALDASAEEGLPAVMRKDLSVASGGSLEIPEGAVLNLNGKKLTNAGELVNNGEISGNGTLVNNNNYSEGENANLALGTVSFVNNGVRTLYCTYGDSNVAVSAYVDGTEISYALTEGDCVAVDAQSGALQLLKAGTATVTVSAKQDDGSTLSDRIKVEVAKKPATVTADNRQGYAGRGMPNLTYTVRGLVAGDTLSVTPILTSVADMDTLGTYPIEISGDAETDNYTITYVNGTLTVSNAPVTGRVNPNTGV